MSLDRRTMLKAGALGAASACGVVLSSSARLSAQENQPSANESLQGKAEHVISIWLGGGMGQIDTFDPKAQGDPKQGKPGSYYRSIPTAVDSVEVCEHLAGVAARMDRVTAVRSVHHEVIDEHAAATNRMHTGRPVSGTVQYPSLGSAVAFTKGALNEEAPPYVLIGYPNLTRGPGFLGAESGYLYLTDTSRGPAGLSRPPEIGAERASRRESLLSGMRASALSRSAGDSSIADYDAAIERSLKLSSPEFQTVFDLQQERAELRESYGGEFGQRCLLARRLCQRGVRFVEVSHNLNFLNGTGWDVHNAGIQQQHELIRELDRALSGLIDDLESCSMLDRTLIVVTTEFGRPPEFDGGGGRGHQGQAFTCVLAGGGLNHRGAYGSTDELSKTIVADAVSVPDFFATIHAALGTDPAMLLYDGDRPVPLTDGGKPIAALFS